MFLSNISFTCSDFHGKFGTSHNVHSVLYSYFRLFKFQNPDRGLIEFKGNLLFTHFSEINAPSGGGDLEIANTAQLQHDATITVNIRPTDKKTDTSNL